jgi:CheY-like chemotaxis protein
MTKILYVEDEPDIQTIAQMALEIVSGFEVTICSSGMEALQTIRSHDPGR